jgi:hypothetical protein
MLKDRLQLHAAWNMRYNKWCQAVDNTINTREQNHWSTTLNIPLDLINIPGKGSHLLYTVTGSNAKYAFLFRYNHTAHLKRHLALAHLAIDCPLCGPTDHTPNISYSTVKPPYAARVTNLPSKEHSVQFVPSLVGLQHQKTLGF